MLRIDALHVAHDDVEVVRGVTVAVSAGEVVALVGANGAGKTTLLRAVCGLHPATSGSVTLDGVDVTRLPAHRLARRGLRFVPADRRLFPAMTVMDNLALGAHPARPDRDRLALVLDLFPRLRDRRGQPAGTMSGGEQQMVAIGRALLSHPTVLVLDEPTTGLSPRLADETYDALASLRATTGLTVLLAEQQVRRALALADRGSVLAGGRVVLEGDAGALHDDPDLASAILGAR